MASLQVVVLLTGQAQATLSVTTVSPTMTALPVLELNHNAQVEIICQMDSLELLALIVELDTTA